MMQNGSEIYQFAQRSVQNSSFSFFPRFANKKPVTMSEKLLQNQFLRNAEYVSVTKLIQKYVLSTTSTEKSYFQYQLDRKSPSSVVKGLLRPPTSPRR